MDKDPDNRVFFDHGGFTAFDDGRNQIAKSDLSSSSSDQQEFQQEVNNCLFP